MIAPQTTIAHYRVESLLATGGMGEVYKAIDTNLGRPVALKVLPVELNHSPERIRRFVQEARAASSLNHPNILTVYDAGEATLDGNGSVYFMAAELLEGKTLREIIHRDRLPLKRVVGYLAQAADGISKAHAAGIIHRDLKPDNIMVTADGFAKVLDFGLAKLKESAPDRTSQIDPALTREGLVLGTVAYMSPEQAQGKPVDARSDIFAFGAIMYEAAARRAPFSGQSDPDILRRIVSEEPPPLTNVPVELDRLVTRALAKDPDERIQSMKDLALELRDISRSYESLRVRIVPRFRLRVRPISSVGFAAAALVAGIVAGYVWHQRTRNADPIRFAIAPPGETLFSGTPNSATALQFAVSPDGRKIVVVAAPPGKTPSLWLRDLGSVEARILPGTEGAWFPFWSPSGDAIAFFADAKLKRISLTGGSAIVLADAISPRGGSWSKEGVILFAPKTGYAPIYRLPAAGGEATEATVLNRSQGDFGHRWPRFLPDGRRFLYMSMSERRPPVIYAGSVGSTEVQAVAPADSQAEFVPPDKVLFLRKGSLLSQPVNPRTLRPQGDPVLIERNVGYAPVIHYGSFSASDRRVIAYAPWTNPGRRLTWLDRQGRPIGNASEPADWGTTALSLHDQRAVLTRAEPNTGNLDVWSVDLVRGVGSRLTTAETDENHPVWAPDGNAVVFTATHGGPVRVYLKRLDGTPEEPLEVGSKVIRPNDWTPDGRYVVYEDRQATDDIWLLPVAEKTAARPFLNTSFSETDPDVSPDGRWIAYAADDSGRHEIYVQPFPAGGDRYRVSIGGGRVPKWSADARELFFVTPNDEIASARVLRPGPRFQFSTPTVLFRIPGLLPPTAAFRTAYEVAADGRLLVGVTPELKTPPTITVSVNWQRAVEP